MFCSNCGAKIADGAKYCQNCGTPVPQQKMPDAEGKSEAKEDTNYYYTQPNNQSTSEGSSNYYYTQPNFNQNPYSQNPFDSGFNQPMVGNYRPGIKKKELVIYLLASIFICGLFQYYWLVCIVNDLNKASRREADTSGGTVLLLTLLTCGIYGVYWFYKSAEKVNYVRRMNGAAEDENLGLIYLILGLFVPVAAIAMIQSELNKVSD